MTATPSNTTSDSFSLEVMTGSRPLSLQLWLIYLGVVANNKNWSVVVATTFRRPHLASATAGIGAD